MTETRTCGCGCGQETRNGSEFIKGHGWAMRKRLLHEMSNGSVEAYRTLAERDWLPVRQFGVEIECTVERNYGENWIETADRIARAISEAGVPCVAQNYNHDACSTWKIVPDSSVGTDGRTGIEVVSPIMKGKDGLAQMRSVMLTLQSLGAKVDYTCGFHVHVNARRLNWTRMDDLLHGYAALESSIDGMVAAQRRYNENQYCQGINWVWGYRRPSEATLRQDGNLRYCKLNLAAYIRHGSVEFRQHQGTLNPTKAEQWVRICSLMVDRAAMGNWTVERESLEDELNLSADRRAWWARRRETLR